MIDIEKEIFNEVANVIDIQYPDAVVYSDLTAIPAHLPCVTIVESSNVADTWTRDTSSNENYVLVMYEVNIYSNNPLRRKAECKEIAKVVDETMMKLGFTRTMLNPVTNEDISVYRLVARYTAKVGKDETIYRG